MGRLIVSVFSDITIIWIFKYLSAIDFYIPIIAMICFMIIVCITIMLYHFAYVKSVVCIVLIQHFSLKKP